MSKPKIYCSTYCNQGHRMTDGMPVDHECRVIPVKALQAERDQDFELAIELLADAPRTMSKGVKP